MAAKNVAALLFLITAHGFHTSLCMKETHHQVLLSLEQGKTNAAACDFPEYLELHMKSQKPFRGSMILRRKDEIDTDAPAYIIRTRENGVVNFVKQENRLTAETAVAYQSSEFGAAFLAKCGDGSFRLEGTMYIEGKKYRVKPAYEREGRSYGDPGAHVYVFSFVKETVHNDLQLQMAMRQRHEMNRRVAWPRWRQSSNATRHRRETKDYYIDVLVALDYVFFRFWMDQAGGNQDNAVQSAKEYVAYIFNGINGRFDTITSLSARLHVRLSGFIIAQTAADAPWTETVKEAPASENGTSQVNANTVLEKLEDYVKLSRNDFPVPDSDHVMLFTGYDLYGTDKGFRFNNTAGFALIGTMCYTDGRSVSVVEDHGGFQSETTATHELGHSLGAKHDGQENSCNSADRYVMAGGGLHPETEANKRNPWHFSSCSVDYFNTHLNFMVTEGFEDSCLLKQSTADGVPTVSGLPGQRSGPDNQCQMIYGNESYLCRGTNFGKPEDVCVSMFCKNPTTTSTCTLNTAAPGTCCGNGKWCLNGECVASVSAADCYMSATCPFGQRQGTVYQDKTCNDMPSGNCYDKNFRKVCCEMCDKSVTGVPGCEFGDKVLECNATFCGRTHENGELYDVQCCGTCNHRPNVTTTVTPPPTTPTTTAGVDPTVNACQDVAIVNGTTCPNFLEKNGLLYCCGGQVQRVCCNSCQNRKSADPACPYGDCDPGCHVLRNMRGRCDSLQRTKCCQTCKELDLRTTPSPSGGDTDNNNNNNNNNGGGTRDTECTAALGTEACGSGRVVENVVAVVFFVCIAKLFV